MLHTILASECITYDVSLNWSDGRPITDP